MHKQSGHFGGDSLEEFGSDDDSDDAGSAELEQDIKGSMGPRNMSAALLGADRNADRGDVDWAAVVENAAINTSAPTEDDVRRGVRSCTSAGWGLPPALLIFMIPCISLIPFYVTMYATSRNAVDSVLTAQVTLWQAYYVRVRAVTTYRIFSLAGVLHRCIPTCCICA